MFVKIFSIFNLNICQTITTLHKVLLVLVNIGSHCPQVERSWNPLTKDRILSCFSLLFSKHPATVFREIQSCGAGTELPEVFFPDFRWEIMLAVFSFNPKKYYTINRLSSIGVINLVIINFVTYVLCDE